MAPPATAQAALDALGVEAICERLAEGLGVRGLAKEVGVSPVSVYDWMDANPERARACARARELAAEAEDDMALMVLETAEENAASIAKAREIAQHRRWRAKALAPRKYGDKVQNEHSGPDGKPIEYTAITRKIVKAP